MENDIGCSMLFSPLPARECRPFIAAALLCTLGTATAHAQVTENVLYNFTGGSDGASPGYLRADTSGPGGALRALYGVGADGGNQNANCPAVGPDPSGCGTVFKLTPPPQGQGTWSESTLWDFTSGKDGENPQSALVASTNRINGTTNLYGTTLGSFAYSGQGDSGSVFSLTGTRLKTILKVRGYKGASAEVTGPVAIDSAGAVYVTAGDPAGRYFGAIIKLTPPSGGQTKWTKTRICNFSYRHGDERTIGNEPAGLAMDQTGTLYGVLRSRNAKKLPCYTMAEKCGGVFKLTPPPPGQTAWTEQTIWKFGRGTDGFDPVHAPIIAKDGTLYGTTVEEYSDCGTVYKLTPPRGNRTHWKEEVIWRFPQSQSSGCGPSDAPIVDKTGAVYGTTIAGAAPNIYKLTPPVEGQSAWTETNLVALDSVGSLIADRNGTLYGGTLTGGSNNAGFVYSLTGTGFVPE